MDVETDEVKALPFWPQLGAMAQHLGRVMLDQLYPPSCPICGGPVTDANGLCGSCFRGMRPITAPLCPRLGLPFEVSLGPDALSAEAIANPPPFGRSRSALVYNDAARRVVARLKYGDRPELARFCARLMAGAGAELWVDRPILVPVPLHASRQFARRYNQSTELARALGTLSGLEVDVLLAHRKKRTRQQVGLSAAQRQRNVSGAFQAHPQALARTRGRGVVLVDDVITTGATVKALTLALQKAGIDKIDVISFARVVIGATDPI